MSKQFFDIAKPHTGNGMMAPGMDFAIVIIFRRPEDPLFASLRILQINGNKEDLFIFRVIVPF
jgi:hypothetical protein